MGSHWSFILSTLLCLVWAVSGPFFGYSDTWQLVINTATTVLTFLAVFLIQNTQNRDGLAIQLKLDELLRALGPARTRLVNSRSARTRSSSTSTGSSSACAGTRTEERATNDSYSVANALEESV